MRDPANIWHDPNALSWVLLRAQKIIVETSDIYIKRLRSPCLSKETLFLNFVIDYSLYIIMFREDVTRGIYLSINRV
jgi:hypothetical protein